MKLSDLIDNLKPVKTTGIGDVEIGGLCYDSRKVSPGDLFFALRGEVTDGHQHIDAALAAGAVAVVMEEERALIGVVAGIQVADTRQAMAAAAKCFYADPTAAMKVVGITGTNGKTTVSYLVEALLEEAGFHAAVVGTVAYRFQQQLLPAPNTTPEAADLQRMMADFRQQGCDALVMEVSSHALAQQRITGVDVDVAVFTNLTPEHLDYHRDMENYFAAKRLLFQPVAGPAPLAVINTDDRFGARLAAELPETVTCGRDIDARVRLVAEELSLQGIQAKVLIPGGELTIKSSLLGPFNLANLLCAAAVGVALKLDGATIERGLARLTRVPGRLEQIENRVGALVLVDYAHTGDALEKALDALRQLQPKRLLTVFGCGGDRDRSKRPVMGEVAARLSNLTIVTSDNPRTEAPEEIIEEIRPGLAAVHSRELSLEEASRPDAQGYLVIADRRAAIDFAAGLVGAGEMLLVAGKGHEDYQIIGRKKFHFDDREELRRALRDRKAS
jgi:UDP-N-acetylmuramoyl-L-alanyl-D-glutamate--2,6-diaminopimelate ligase